MNNEYIERKTLLDKLENLYKTLMKGHYVDEAEGVLLANDIIKQEPYIITKEKIYANWLPCNSYDIRDNFYKCSACGRTINIVCGDSIKNYPYCHCGAKMIDVS